MKFLRALILFFLSFGFLCSCTPYDHDKPDTKANRAGFEQFFSFRPQSSNVTGIYFFADEWGSRASYCFAFSAPSETIEQIIRKWNLKPMNERRNYYVPPVTPPLPWWDAGERERSQYYESRNETSRTDYYLWYDPKTKKCQAAIIYW